MNQDDTAESTLPGVSRRGALGRIGGTLAVAAGVAWRNGEKVMAQEATPATTAVPPDFKVVLHAAEEQDWPYVVSNLKNLTQEWPQAHLRVVADGSAVLNLQGSNVLTNELAKAAAAGVEVQVCPNALREHEIAPESIPSYAQTKLGGVVALVMAQHEGYAYVKP